MNTNEQQKDGQSKIFIFTQKIGIFYSSVQKHVTFTAKLSCWIPIVKAETD